MYQGLAQKYRLALNEVNPQLFLDRENTSHKALNATLTRYTMLLFSYLHLCVLLRPETAVWFWFLNFYFTKKSLTNGTKSSFRPFTQTHPRSTFSSICIIICLLHFFLWIISEELQTCLCVCVQSLSHVRLFSTPWTVACQAPLSKGFSRQEYWSGGCHFLLHSICPTQASNLCLFRLLLCRQILYHRATREGGIQGKQKGLELDPPPRYLSSLNFSLQLLLSSELFSFSTFHILNIIFIC